MRVEPSSSYGRRDSNVISWLLIIVPIIACLAISLTGMHAAPGARTASVAAVSTPVVTVFLVEPATASPSTLAHSAAPAPRTVSNPPPAGNATISVSPDGVVNIRSGPGTVYEILGSLTSSRSANVMGKSLDGLWWQVSLDGRTGWVYASLVTFTGDAAAVPSVVAQ